MKFTGLVGLDTRNNWEHFQDILFNPLNTGLFLPLFRGNPCIAQKRLNGFSWNFQKTDLTLGATWNIFGMLQLTPWILGRFIYFLDPWFFVILWKNRWTDFHEICMKCQARHKKLLTTLFHTLLDCFTVSHLGALDVFVSKATVKSMSGFLWNFQDMLAMTQGTIWNILGMIGLTPWA